MVNLDDLLQEEEELLQELKSKNPGIRIFSLMPENIGEMIEMRRCYRIVGNDIVNSFRLQIGYLTDPTVDNITKIEYHTKIANDLDKLHEEGKDVTYLLKVLKEASKNIIFECVWHEIFLRDVQKYNVGDDCATLDIGASKCRNCQGYNKDCNEYYTIKS